MAVVDHDSVPHIAIEVELEDGRNANLYRSETDGEEQDRPNQAFGGNFVLKLNALGEPDRTPPENRCGDVERNDPANGLRFCPDQPWIEPDEVDQAEQYTESAACEDESSTRQRRPQIVALHGPCYEACVMELSNEIKQSLANTFVVIPVLNEQDSIRKVLEDLPSVRQVIVVDNGSTDESAAIAEAAGAFVLVEPKRGYGKACLSGIAHVDAELARSPLRGDAIVAFVDGDYSDHPDELPRILEPITLGEASFVVGSRSLGNREHGSMPFQAVFGNWLACSLMRIFWGARFSDLGPFRAIRHTDLIRLGMSDEDFGWTIEMQIKAVQHGIAWREVPVSYRKRIGVSKISGTITGTIRAGYKIIYTILRYRFGGTR